MMGHAGMLAAGQKKGLLPESMGPMLLDPEGIHNYLAPGEYGINFLAPSKALIFYTYCNDHEVSGGPTTASFF